MKKTWKFLMLVFVLALCMLPVKSQAASKIINLQAGKTYSSYDMTGDGKKDKLKITRPDSTTANIYINGSKKASADLGKGGDVYLCNLSEGRECLVVEYGYSGGSTCYILIYKNGSIQEKDLGTSFTNISLKSVSGNTISFTSTVGKYERLFNDQGLTSCTIKYKVCNTKVTRVSSTSSLSGTYKAAKAFKTSSSKAMKNTKGVYVKKGKTVKLLKVYFSSGKGPVIQISVGGKKGWVRADGYSPSGSSASNYYVLKK